MAISFPLSMPTSTNAHSSIQWIQRNIVGLSSSPFTAQQQVQDWGGDFWELDVSFDPMDRDDAFVWIAFLSKLRGANGTFLYGDELTRTKRGNAAATGQVNGASQTGNELVTDDWNFNVTDLFREGDKIQIDNSLYMVLNDVNSDGGGNATLDIWPSLRGHADNSVITHTDAQGRFRLVPGTDTVERVGRNQLWLVSFRAVEAL
ncbi:MAG: hypothetical protein GTN64_05485 [Candidatus Latescibacteria bacterium]|nr:hypothetical protein [Candidatus Latescibacterota bacterium]NIO78062.1 hypothetical protein [Candidatus Latescibacterota bacterium]